MDSNNTFVASCLAEQSCVYKRIIDILFTYGEEKKVYQNKRWKFNVGQRRKMLTFPFFFDLSDSLINVSSLCSVNLLKCL